MSGRAPGGTGAVLEVRANGARCCGAGNCARIAPQVFDQDARDGTVILLQRRPPPELAPLVREAAAVCPTSAIAVTVTAAPAPTTRARS